MLGLTERKGVPGGGMKLWAANLASFQVVRCRCHIDFPGQAGMIQAQSCPWPGP
jgi:hypothetical protein